MFNYSFVGILYNIRSAYNVGSIFRTASACGMKKLYLFGITPTPENEKVKKTSLGAENYVEWEKIYRIKKIIKELKKENYTIVSLEQTKKSIYLQNFKPKRKTCFIVGNEIRGISKEVLNLSDFIVEIPIFGQKESLNVSIAFSVAVYFSLFKLLK
jgi:23S rRNA (guanosine2251-2'-O)-methyltransferase